MSALVVLVVSLASARAQNAHPDQVALAMRIGGTLGTARGEFPSIIVGDSRRGTGALPQELGQSGLGVRFDIAVHVPLFRDFGLSLAVGSQTVGVGYPGDSSRLATRFDVQSVQGQIGAQWNVLHDSDSYYDAGLRSIYIDGGFDVGLFMLANRVESSRYADTLSSAPAPISGSFTTGEPFRNVIAVRGAVGMRFAATPNIEIVAEASYAHALNPLFSGEALSDNDFAIDVLGATVGIAYRY